MPTIHDALKGLPDDLMLDPISGFAPPMTVKVLKEFACNRIRYTEEWFCFTDDRWEHVPLLGGAGALCYNRRSVFRYPPQRNSSLR